MDAAVAEHSVLTEDSCSMKTTPSFSSHMRPSLLVKKSLGTGPQVRENTQRLAELALEAPSLIARSIRQHLESEDTLVKEVEEGLMAGRSPELVQDCCGGTYLMSNAQGKQCAVFKPADEEPYAPENPKGYVGSEMYSSSPLKEGVEVGMAAERECAAYLLDHGHRGNVPRTVMLRIHHSRPELKYGSLQVYVHNICSVEDMGPSKFESADVHNIAILDIRLCNSDRHPGNILVTQAEGGKFRLVPIDHGFVLPKWRYLHDLDFCWLHWPQAKQPFTDEEIQYIDELDAEADADFLRNALSLSEDCLRTLHIGTMLLKLGAHAGLTLQEIGTMMVRPHHDERSVLEQEVWRSEEMTLKELRRYPSGVLRVINAFDGHAAMDAAFLRHLRTNLGAAIENKLAQRPRTDDGGLSDVIGSIEL
eukprot:CAMPEP_0114551946 /NCGR_PEP_ID=MMETSP0114-20121206/6867_1 /TAXON_ID=31324 /ORGANISM="Goniomonas sp, Strain m" /LENGTH=419 /DNA_ID=CAMNT_0001736799 /DNA_START=219 /DNA_END=1478 /DNA_ORIENTATION=+